MSGNLGLHGEDTDHVEPQGVEGWFWCRGSVRLQSGWCFACGGDSFQSVSEADPTPQLYLDENERLGSLVQKTVTSEVRFRAELSTNGVERLELARA